jgi:hypothetical protein
MVRSSRKTLVFYRDCHTWLAENVNGLSLEIPEADYDIERPYEANTYRAYSASDWGGSLRSSFQWMKDQPFSGRAEKSAAYLANTIFEDYDMAEKIARFGLIANPKDPGFNITLAYAYARRNQLPEARNELKKYLS